MLDLAGVLRNASTSYIIKCISSCGLQVGTPYAVKGRAQHAKHRDRLQSGSARNPSTRYRSSPPTWRAFGSCFSHAQHPRQLAACVVVHQCRGAAGGAARHEVAAALVGVQVVGLAGAPGDVVNHAVVVSPGARVPLADADPRRGAPALSINARRVCQLRNQGRREPLRDSRWSSRCSWHHGLHKGVLWQHANQATSSSHNAAG